jgi:hypothetical protein
MNPTARLMAVVLICAASGAPALAHAAPQLNWKIYTAPPSLTVRLALGPSNPRDLSRGSRRSRGHRSELAGSSDTATGWTRPLGVRVALRW